LRLLTVSGKANLNQESREPELAVKGIAMKVLIKSAWGSDDPTKAAFAFLHANAFAEAGHEVQNFCSARRSV
jgi:hypothetical protein